MLCLSTGGIYIEVPGKMALAFCTFFGLTIHPGKIKATIVGKINPMHDSWTKPDETKYFPSTLKVYDYQ
jgi:hypothetical protein